MAVIGLRVQCACGGWLEVDPSQLGRTNICPFCHRRVIVVHPEPTGVQKRAAGPAPWLRRETREYRPPWDETSGHEESSIPWLQWRTIGLFAALWRTIKGVLLHPRELFSNVPATGGTLRHTSFLTLILAVFFLISFYYGRSLFNTLAQLMGKPEPTLIWILAGVCWVFAIVVWLAQTAVNAAVINALLKMTGSGAAGYQVTYIVCVYTTGAVIPLAAVITLVLAPSVGLAVAFVWWIYSTVAGLRSAHRSNIYGPALAVLLTAGLNVLALLLLAAIQMAMMKMIPEVEGLLPK